MMLQARHALSSQHRLARKAEERNLSKLREFQGIHAGRVGFVIGNGPSLCASDLDAITGHVAIASNKIYLAFQNTEWRPTYYSVIDSYVLDNIKAEIEGIAFPTFLPDVFGALVKPRADFNFLKLLSEGTWDGSKYLDYTPGFSNDITKGVYAGECVTNFNIQILAYMGCDPIVLLGVDFSFALAKEVATDPSYGTIYEAQGEVNHFHPDYRPKGEKWTMPNLHEQRASFAYACDYLSQHGRRLINASRKTKLDVVPRQNLEEMLR